MPQGKLVADWSEQIDDILVQTPQSESIPVKKASKCIKMCHNP